jgi:hypothetical protein
VEAEQAQLFGEPEATHACRSDTAAALELAPPGGIGPPSQLRIEPELLVIVARQSGDPQSLVSFSRYEYIALADFISLWHDDPHLPAFPSAK